MKKIEKIVIILRMGRKKKVRIYLCAEPVVDLSVMVNAVHCMPRRYSLADNPMDTHHSCPLTLNLSRAAEMNLANWMSPLCDWRL